MTTKTGAPPSTTPVVRERLTKEQAAEKYGNKAGLVWDEDLQDFVPLGQALVIEEMGRPVDLARNLDAFKTNRDVVIRFVQGQYFEEAQYVKEGKHKGDLIPGQLGDYYKVPGSDQKALTKRGASKIKQLFRWHRGAARRVDGESTKEHCSALIEVPIVDHLGRTVGAGIGACSTAEKAFTSQNAIKKYGGWCEWDNVKRQLNVTRPPDYRAALHDITSKATKRADTQATIVAAALEEIFTVARDDEGDGGEDAPAERPVFPNQPPPLGSRRLPTAKKGLLAIHGGKTIGEVEKSARDDLLKIRDWAKGSTVYEPIAEAIDEYLAVLTDQLEEVAGENLP